MQITDEMINAGFLATDGVTYEETTAIITAAIAASPAGEGVETYTDLERKYLPLAKKIVNGRSLNHPYPGDDTTRIVGFRVPAEVAGLSEALFALDTIRAVLASLKGDE